MPFYDRHWWLRLVGGVFAVLFGLLVLARLVLPTLVYARVMYDTWVAITLGMGQILVAMLLALSTGPARDRMRRRVRALGGDLDAMPPARLPRIEGDGRVGRVRRPLPRPPRQPDWEPLARLAVYWRAPWFDRVYSGFLVLIALIGLVISISVLAPFARFLLTGEPRSVLDVSITAIALLLVLFLPVSLYLLYWAVPALVGRRPGVEVTPEGISTRQLWGRQRTVRWDEARLLEISAPRRFGLMKPHRTFRFYGARSVAVWRDELRPLADYRLDLFEPDRPYRYQVRERMDALLAHVTKHTGLVPRTFSPRLADSRPATEANAGHATAVDPVADQPDPRGREAER
jgi:hypothetical protein